MSRRTWHVKRRQPKGSSKPYKRHIRWRPWVLGWKSIIPVAVIVTVGQFYTQGAVTWPDTAMRSLDVFVRSAYADTKDFLQQEQLPGSAASIPQDAVEHRVTRIVDGDTVYTKDGTKIRLYGIDTPERDQPYGKQATRALDRLIKTKIFVLEKDTDRYGRLVGVLYTPEGLNVNLEMVCGGHAWWYERYARFDSDLEDCQESAQEAGLGLWANDDPVAPWVWRRR